MRPATDSVSVAAFAKTRAWLPTIEIKSTFVSPLKVGTCRGEVSIVKAGAELVGRPGGKVRPPLTELTAEERAELATLIGRLGEQ